MRDSLKIRAARSRSTSIPPRRENVSIVESSTLGIQLRLTGPFDLTLCNETTAIVDRWRGARTGVAIFTDVSGVDDYAVPARERFSQWLRGRRHAFDEFHALVEGPTIAFAIKIIGLAAGVEIVSHRTKSAFDGSCARRFRKSR